MVRCSRPFTASQNASQGLTSSANDEYAGSRFASVGTRSASAMRTVASEPPLDSGSATTQVATLSPYSLNLKIGARGRDRLRKHRCGIA